MKDVPDPPRGGPERSIFHEARSRRGLLRFTTPIEVTIEGRTLAAADWSLGGFSFVDAEQAWHPGSERVVRLVFPGKNVGIVFDCHCAVVRVTRDGRIGWRFLDLKPDQMSYLRSAANAAATGQVLGAESALALVQSSASRAGGGASGPAPGEEGAGRGRNLGYLLLVLGGLVLATVVALSLYGRLLTVQSDFAAVSGTLARVSAAGDGFVRGPLPPLGQPVSPGETLFTIGDPELDAKMRLAEAEVERQEAEVASMRRRHRQAVDFLGRYAALADAALAQAQAELAGAEAARRASVREADRVDALHRGGHASAAAVDQATRRRLEGDSAVAAARAAVAAATTNAAIAVEGRFFTGSRIEGREPHELAEDLAVAEAELAFLRARRSVLAERREELRVASPCACMVHAVLLHEGEWVRGGAPALLLVGPHDAGPTIVAKVPLTQALKLNIGGRANILLATESAPRDGVIDEISLTLPPLARPGLPDAVDLDPHFASVVVRLPGIETAPVGTPAQVIFPVPFKRAVFAWFGL